ncbi:MAG: hypothetical protein IPL63_00575 [Saprospiraceae bacterium]|nr:hypothetical protein [Saprospiraceae bacterium]
MESETKKKETKNDWIFTLLLITSILLMMVYPFILFGNIMSFAAAGNNTEHDFCNLAFISFAIFSTLYPVTFIVSLLFRKRKILIISTLPILHVFITVLLGIIWMYCGN